MIITGFTNVLEMLKKIRNTESTKTSSMLSLYDMICCLVTFLFSLYVKYLKMAKWRTLACLKNELRLDITLVCGQSFRWREIEPGMWRSVLLDNIWTLKQNQNEVQFMVHVSNADNELCSLKHKETLKDYFQLEISLQKAYDHWIANDLNFRSKAPNFPGVRILRQDPVENLFSFICSSNNHINRISSMVEKLCLHYGKLIGTVDGVAYYNFPSIEALSGADVEERLRTLGFGYRAKYIHQSAQYIMENGGTEWLYKLRKVEYKEAHQALLNLCGVGAKVADCVCLMSLDKHGAIPVDTHVWKIACRDYNIKGLNSAKSLTDSIYKVIGDYFRSLWGEYAGWAQSVLFSAELRKFQDYKLQKPTEINEGISASRKRLQKDTENASKVIRKRKSKR